MKALSKPLKILLAVLTIWPLVYVPLFMIFVMSMSRGFESLLIVHGLTMMLVMGLLVFYMVHLFKTPRMDNLKKILWAIALLWGNMIAMPIYFFCHVWPDSDVPA